MKGSCRIDMAEGLWWGDLSSILHMGEGKEGVGRWGGEGGGGRVVRGRREWEGGERKKGVGRGGGEEGVGG